MVARRCGKKIRCINIIKKIWKIIHYFGKEEVNNARRVREQVSEVPPGKNREAVEGEDARKMKS